MGDYTRETCLLPFHYFSETFKSSQVQADSDKKSDLIFHLRPLLVVLFHAMLFLLNTVAYITHCLNDFIVPSKSGNLPAYFAYKTPERVTAPI